MFSLLSNVQEQIVTYLALDLMMSSLNLYAMQTDHSWQRVVHTLPQCSSQKPSCKQRAGSGEEFWCKCHNALVGGYQSGAAGIPRQAAFRLDSHQRRLCLTAGVRCVLVHHFWSNFSPNYGLNSHLKWTKDAQRFSAKRTGPAVEICEPAP